MANPNTPNIGGHYRGRWPPANTINPEIGDHERDQRFFFRSSDREEACADKPCKPCNCCRPGGITPGAFSTPIEGCTPRLFEARLNDPTSWGNCDGFRGRFILCQNGDCTWSYKKNGPSDIEPSQIDLTITCNALDKTYSLSIFHRGSTFATAVYTGTFNHDQDCTRNITLNLTGGTGVFCPPAQPTITLSPYPLFVASRQRRPDGYNFCCACPPDCSTCSNLDPIYAVVQRFNVPCRYCEKVVAMRPPGLRPCQYRGVCTEASGDQTMVVTATCRHFSIQNLRPFGEPGFPYEGAFWELSVTCESDAGIPRAYAEIFPIGHAATPDRNNQGGGYRALTPCLLFGAHTSRTFILRSIEAAQNHVCPGSISVVLFSSLFTQLGSVITLPDCTT